MSLPPAFEPWALWTVVVVFGLILGSFLNVVIHRLPRRQSIVRPRSRCPECRRPVAAYDNLPVLSYLLLRGRCRHCGARISPLYPLVELATSAFVSALVARFGLQPALAGYLLLTLALLASTFIDLEHQIIPNRITLPGIAVLFALALAGELIPALHWPLSALQSLLGILVGGGIVLLIIQLYHLATGQYGMGGGDLKLLAMVGALLGPKGVVLTLVLASFTGTLLCLPLMLLGRVGRHTAISFGPFLALGALVSLFFGEDLLRLYQSSLGLQG